MELLKSPINCPVVTSILRTRSLKHGWGVYSDRILNAEGVCIAPGEVAASRQGNDLNPDYEVPSNQSTLGTRMSQSAGRSSPKMDVNVLGMDR